MKTTMRLLSAGLLLLALAGCDSRTERTDGGGVLLTISDFGTLPLTISVNDTTTPDRFQIDDITITSVVKDTGGTTSPLMNVELSSYQITYSRTDQGTRLPPTLVGSIFGTVPVSGTNVINGMPIVLAPQLTSLPLSDLSARGIDSETGSAVVGLRVGIQFFGRTLGGQNVATQVAQFTVQFRQ
jgi:hypothetical protein